MAAIVRDELDNPAWGVEKWLRATLPYVDDAVVVDTGSIDGTREKLEELAGKFRHLRVYDRAFDDFASSRNYSLEHVKTDKVLVLDADELLLPEEFGRLNQFVKEKLSGSYSFFFKQVKPDGNYNDFLYGLLNTRLFEIKNRKFNNSNKFIGAFESLDYEDESFKRSTSKFNLEIPCEILPSEVAIIKHFLSPWECNARKKKHWYEDGDILDILPIEHAQKYGWKKRNPMREEFDRPEWRIKKRRPWLVGDFEPS